MTDLLKAAEARAAGTSSLADRPRERRLSDQPGSAPGVRVILDPKLIRKITKDGVEGVNIGGCASTTEDPYEMYDYWGPYTEIVSTGAFGKTLASSPLVEFTLNHGAGGGIPMAHTRNATLALSETDEGLCYEAFVDPTRTDVANMLKAMERGDLAEASFKFRIDSGKWSPDYTEYRIEAVDLNRGDVSSVNFGANPNATSGLRASASGGAVGVTYLTQASGTSTIFAAASAAVTPKPVVFNDDDFAGF